MTITHTSLLKKSDSILADIKGKVKIGKVFGGYFNSSKNAQIFANTGIAPYMSDLPKDIKFADFGGGDGFLTAQVRSFLEKSGKKVEGIVVDANPYYLQDAGKKGFITLEAALEETRLKNFDLIIMRSVLHYNPKTIQKIILQKVKKALKPGGIFVHQLSSGNIYNVKLKNALSHMKSLQRIHKHGAINFITEEEYLELCNSMHLPTKLLGYAPEESWSIEELFDRFHPEVKSMTKDQKANYALRNKFLKEAKELVLKYKNTTPIKGIKIHNNNIRVWRTYPIFVSRLPKRK